MRCPLSAVRTTPTQVLVQESCRTGLWEKKVPLNFLASTLMSKASMRSRSTSSSAQRAGALPAWLARNTYISTARLPARGSVPKVYLW